MAFSWDKNDVRKQLYLFLSTIKEEKTMPPNPSDVITPAPQFHQHNPNQPQSTPAMTMADLDAHIDSRINLATRQMRAAAREPLTNREKAYLAGAAIACVATGVGITLGVQKFRNRNNGNSTGPTRTAVTVK